MRHVAIFAALLTLQSEALAIAGEQIETARDLEHVLVAGEGAGNDARNAATDGGLTVDASLTDTYWRIDALLGEDLPFVEGRREPHIVFGSGEQSGVSATVGCNMMRGSFEAVDGKITFGPMASTMMACPPPLDGMERSLAAALGATAAYEIEGETLVLKDAGGEIVVVLTTVHF